PLIDGTAVEQHDRPFRCFFAERGTLTFNLLERGGGLALNHYLEFSSGDFQDRYVGLEHRFVSVFQLTAVPQHLIAAAPALARQPALVTDEIELSVTQSDDLS